MEIRLDGLLDLAATKVSVIQKRAASRDYRDLDLLLDAGGVELVEALVAARKVYGPFFNPQISLKALTCFSDGDLGELPFALTERLRQKAAYVDLDDLERRL